MSRDYLSDERIESEEAFETALAEGIEKAIYGGVDVCGSWEFDIRGSTHHWDVEIFELVRDGDETQK